MNTPQVATLCAGAGLALTAGLLMGVAMRPQLAIGERPGGPQTFAPWGGARSAGPTDKGLGYASYAGQIPTYVTGTDAEKAAQVAVAPQPTPETYAQNYYVSPLRGETLEPPAEPRDVTPADDGALAERIAYPSLEGGAAYEDVSRSEMTPVVQAADIGDEAAAEATGDTSVPR
ncbi:hypothetical protein LJR225_001602 [Phenylobacterium sp. LjRoot225]|uniref:hypothetical protein n=1 Tax=Phenylobacterium sp. LjRoot225 TaxID=3342285 RepID=UPI003ECE480C